MTNTKITAALIFLRDELKRQAKEVFDPPNEKLKAIKAEVHDAKIEKNRLLKQAQEVQEMVTISMMVELNEEIKLEDEYRFKSADEIAQETLKDTLSRIREENK